LRPLAAALWLLLTTGASAADRTYELAGRIEPPVQASVSLYGATTPFSSSKLTDASGRFRFTKLLPGQYTVAAFSPGYGERRITVDIGPSSVDSKGRYETTVRLDKDTHVGAGAMVNLAELAVPDSARREYAEAQRRLAARDITGATDHLERALEIAPQFSGAWNNLGTIAYQTREFPKAEVYFRRSLQADPDAYEPLMNLGGVLLTLGKPEEAYQFNLYSVLKRPADALANSQLGMNYVALGKIDLAEKYLLEARRLDPAHFSHPQLSLTEVYLRRGDKPRAIEMLTEFLRYHPDAPNADKIREGIAKLRN
jgi:tetratricopeptide (TPR) repeat protein